MAKLEIDGLNVQALWRSRGLTDLELSERTGISSERIEQIIDSNSGKVGELEKIARCTKLTLTDILVGQAPSKLPTTDFRTLGSNEPKTSPELEHAIETLSARIEFLLEDVVPSRTFANVVDLPDAKNATAHDAAAEVRSILRVTDSLQQKNLSNSFLFWRTRIEQRGVLCSTMPLGKAARGFSIYQMPIAAIVVASEEKNEGAKLFSLCHELGHLLRRESAISDQSWSKATERWCNSFAAFLIMPEPSFVLAAKRFNASQRVSDDLKNLLRDLAEAFGVSLSAVAYHMDAIGIGNGDVGSRFSSWSKLSSSEFELEEDDEEESGSGGGPDTHFYAKMNDYGLTYIQLVQSVLASGRMSRYEAADALNIRNKYIDGLFERAHQRVLSYGA